MEYPICKNCKSPNVMLREVSSYSIEKQQWIKEGFLTEYCCPRCNGDVVSVDWIDTKKRAPLEFRDFDNQELFDAIFNVASLNGFDDVSWHNDAMPSMQRIFEYEKKPPVTVKIWVDWKNPNYSDFADQRISGKWKQIAITELNDHDDVMFESHHDSAIDAILDLRNIINKYE